MQSSEALPEESCKAPGTEQQRKNILPVKSDPAYICPLYRSAQSSGQCCGRQLISDFNHRYHKRDQTIFDIRNGFSPPKRIPRIFMASRIAPYSSPTVGKNRKMTDSGITILSEICIRSIAATNSLTVVEDTR